MFTNLIISMSKIILISVIVFLSFSSFFPTPGQSHQCANLIEENKVPKGVINQLTIEPSRTQANVVDTTSYTQLPWFNEREELYTPQSAVIIEFPDKAKEMIENRTENMEKIKFLMEVGKLKHIERAGWVLNKIKSPERIAGHMYRMAIIPMLVLSENSVKRKINIDKVVKLSLVHDIAECIVGDFTPYDDITPAEKHRLEEDAADYLGSLLPSSVSSSFKELFREYEEQSTPEAKLTKELDRFEMVLTAFEYEKREYKRTGRLPNLGEFFDFDKILSYIQDRELKEMITELLHQRAEFLANACVHKCAHDESFKRARKLK